MEDNGDCPGQEDDTCDVLPLDFVVGVNGAPMGLMAKVVDGTADLDGIPDDADPDDEALPDGCVT